VAGSIENKAKSAQLELELEIGKVFLWLLYLDQVGLYVLKIDGTGISR
jgi:hypothetical protein